MKTLQPAWTLEQLLLALERELIEATDEEILAAAKELGMDPSMKGSAAFFGIKYGYLARMMNLEGLRPWVDSSGTLTGTRTRRRPKSEPPKGL